MPDLSQVADLLRQRGVWGNSALHWLAAAVVVGMVFLSLCWLRRGLLRHEGATMRLAAVDRLVRRTKVWFLLAAAILCGACLLNWPGRVWELVLSAGVVVLLVQAALWADALAADAIAHYTQRQREVDAAGATTLSALGFLGRMAIWTAAVLLAAANLGINVTALVAGFGIGGVAVALAAQNILGDLFASASIVLDKPFVLGDFIVVDDKMGTIEYIGLKTTRLRSLSGEQLIFSNTDLLKSRIHNYKRMRERRVLFTLGAAYDTPHEKLAAVPDMLREIIESQRPVRFDRAHFARYGDSSLVFEVVYYVLAPDYNAFMDVQQAVNLAIHRRFAEEKIEFAFPTRTVHLRQQA